MADFDQDGTINARIGGPPTVFTRSSSVAGLFDTYGNYQIADVDEARYSSARRVKNLFADHSTAYSDDITTVGWSSTGNVLSATTWEAASTFRVLRYIYPINFVINQFYVLSATISCTVDTTFYMRVGTNSSSGYLATSTPQRFAARLQCTGATNQAVFIRNAAIVAGGDYFTITDCQVESMGDRDVLDQEPAEYQAVNATGDGIGWYSTANGNTHNLSTGVVTDSGPGEDLTTIEGLWVEGQSAQAFAEVDQNDLTGWTLTGSPVVALQPNISVMGKASSLIDVDDTNYVHKILPASTFTNSAVISPQLFLRQGADTTGTLRMLATSGNGEWTIDLSLLPANSAQHEKVTRGHPAVSETLPWQSASDGGSGIQISGTSPGLLELDVAYVGMQEKDYAFSPILGTSLRGASTCYWETVSGLAGVVNNVGFGFILSDMPFSSAEGAGVNASICSLHRASPNYLLVYHSNVAGTIVFRKRALSANHDISLVGMSWQVGDSIACYFKMYADGTTTAWCQSISGSNADTDSMGGAIEDVILLDSSLTEADPDSAAKFLELKVQVPPPSDGMIASAIAAGTLP